MNDTYQYKVSDFEGPLDLLLYLIEKNKVDIYNIPIADIADQFNAYVAQLEGFDMDYASKFFVMAATLLQIKSRLLLPKPPKREDEESEDDLQDVLIQQLVEYKQMKEASSVMADVWRQRSYMLGRPPTPLLREMKFVGTITWEGLYRSFRILYESLEEKEPEIHIHQELYSVEECMQRVVYLLRQTKCPVPVQHVFSRSRSKIELVVTFLAVLELLKLGQCRTVAEGNDGNAVALQYTPSRYA